MVQSARTGTLDQLFPPTHGSDPGYWASIGPVFNA